jgi:hypothetical protein
MVYATLAGSLLHAIIVAWMMQRRGYRFRLRWYGMTRPRAKSPANMGLCC